MELYYDELRIEKELLAYYCIVELRDKEKKLNTIKKEFLKKYFMIE